MPPRIDTPFRSAGSKGRLRVDTENIPIGEYRTRYPVDDNGTTINLRPDSKASNFLKEEILIRANESERWMTQRHPTWQKIDETLTAFIQLDEEEQELKSLDERKHVSIVVPESYATLETLLTYMMAAFGVSPMFQYEGIGPEDTYGAILLEKIVEQQVFRSKALLALHTQWRDAFSYGIGVLTPTWEVESGVRPVTSDIIEFDSSGQSFVVGQERTFEETVLFEGTKLHSIDPYRYLPDPSVEIHQPQDGEYVGWKDEFAFNRLLHLENEPGSTFFNVEFLKQERGDSSIYRHDTSGREAQPGTSRFHNQEFGETNIIDVVNMYIDLIPKDWDLGKSRNPEKWLFALAADEVIIQAHPIDLNQRKFPITVAAPDFGGHELMPVSRMELMSGLQTGANFWYNSHVAEVRKAIHNNFIVDPRSANMKDVYDMSRSGKIIRTRKALWGKGVKDIIEQLPVHDVTRNHMADMNISRGITQEVMGTVDSVKGVQRTGGERVTAAEFQATRAGALSRLQKAARIISLQSMHDLGYDYAYNTQQFMTQETYVKTVGRWEEVLKQEFGEFLDRGQALVTPFDLDVAFDIVPHDGSIEGSQDANVWIQLLPLIQSDPELAQAIDSVRVFQHVARLAGAKNAQDFIKRGGNISPTVVPDSVAQQTLAAGNGQAVGAI